MIRNNKFKLVKKSIVDIITIGAVALSSFSGIVPKKVFASELDSSSLSISDVDDQNDKIMVENIRVYTDSDSFNFLDNEGYLTREQINSARGVTVKLFDDCDYSFLNEFSNLKNLSILDHSISTDLNFLDKSFFSNDCNIEYTSGWFDPELVNKTPDCMPFDSTRFNCLKDINTINSLNIYLGKNNIFNFDWKFISELKNVKKLVLYNLNAYDNFRYYDFSHLDSLRMYFEDKCDISSDIIDKIKKDVSDFEYSNEVDRTNPLIKSIIDGLNIDDSMEDIDKLNAILAQVLSMCSSEKEQFYDTYSYSYWVNVLCHSVGIDSYIVSSKNNFFNVVNIDGVNYYVDASMLANEKVFVKKEIRGNSGVQQLFKKESALKLFLDNDKNNIMKLQWYLRKPSLDDVGHKLNYIPFGLNLDFGFKSNESIYPEYSDYVHNHVEYVNNEISKSDIVPIHLTDVSDYNYNLFNSFSKREDKYSAVRIYDNAFDKGLDWIDENDFNDSPIIFYQTRSFPGHVGVGHPFNEDRFSVLKRIPSIKLLYLDVFDSSSNIDWDFVSSLNIENLVIHVDFNSNVDITKFVNVKFLSLVGEPYDVATYVNNEDISFLKSNGVIFSYDKLDKLIEINEELDEIYSRITVDQNMSDKQKLDEILFYIFEKFTYDPSISSDIRNNVEHFDKTAEKYSDGFLYGALELNTKICGNYSSFLNAMCKRAGIPCYMFFSENHSWNGVELSGKKFFIDSTILDGSSYVDIDGEYSINEVFSKNLDEVKNLFSAYLSNPDDINSEYSQYLYKPFGFENLSNNDLSSFDSELNVSLDNENKSEVPLKNGSNISFISFGVFLAYFYYLEKNKYKDSDSNTMSK